MADVFAPAGSTAPVGPKICVLGDAGAGKSRLAATFPNPLFLDVENGAYTALPGGVNRVVIQPGPTVMADITKWITLIGKSPWDEQFHSYNVSGSSGKSLCVGTVVIDSMDAIQQPLKMLILGGRDKMERGNWDTLLNRFAPLVHAWNSLKCIVVVVSHTKRDEGEENKPGSMDFAVQGALKSQIPRWFDLILHIMVGPDGVRSVVTQPMVAKGYRIQAKDRHNILRGLGDKGIIKLGVDKDGYPEHLIANTVLERIRWQQT